MNTQVVNTDSPVRPGHSDRGSPHPERRRFWKTDRNVLESLTTATRSFLFVFKSVHRSGLRLLLLTAQVASANVVFEWQKQQSCVCTVWTGQTYLNNVTPWKENIHFSEELVERYNASVQQRHKLQWLPASQIRMMSLAKQQSQQSQNRQAGSPGPGLIYDLQILFSHGLWSFFPLSKCIIKTR